MARIDDLPAAQRAVVTAALEVSRRHDTVPFLVGGPVRDLVLGRVTKDVDLALESGADRVARDLARKLEATLRSYPQFLTHKIVADDLAEIDVATTRAEEYAAPGALPIVTPSTLVRDLARRDFSVNAVALDLSTGAVVDPLGGLDDVGRRQIRILHDRSFVDDPTRILRAIRFAVRLDFEIEAKTLQLMRRAIASGALQTVSRERVWREILRSIEEEHAAAILFAFGREGVLSSFAGAHRETPAQRLRALDRLSRLRDETDRVVILLAAILENVDEPLDALRGVGLSLRRRKHVTEIAGRATDIRQRLVEADAEVDRLAIARDASDELLIFAGVDIEGFAAWFDRLLEFRRLQLAFSGADLGLPPGPHVGIALDRARQAIFLGEVAPEQAQAFARATALKYLEERLNQK